MNQLPLFVFGTLRRGECNHHYLAGRYERMVPAVLEGYHRVRPLMIRPRPDGRVDGELYFLDPARYDDTLRGCDDLEEIPPGTDRGREYWRVRVSVRTSDGAHDAWAYIDATCDL